MDVVVPPPEPIVRREALPFVLWVFGSMVAHLVFAVAMLWLNTVPDVINIEVPSQMELGVQDLDKPGGGGAPKAAEPTPEPPKPVPVRKARPAPTKDIVIHPVITDASVPDASPSDAATDAASAPQVATQAGEGGEGTGTGRGVGTGAGDGEGDGVGPRGAYVGLHVDLSRVRDSSLSLEARALLAVIPQWQRMFDGAGLTPLDDFVRVFVASPNLDPKQFVIAAQVRGGRRVIDAAAARISGQATPHYNSVQGLPALPFTSASGEKRLWVVLANDAVVIAPPDDIARVLALSHLLTQRMHEESVQNPDRSPGLLQFTDAHAELSVENARRFAPNEGVAIPKRLRLSIRPVDEYHAALELNGLYDSAAQAQGALEQVDTWRKLAAAHPRSTYLGIESALNEAVVERHEDRLTLSGVLTLHQMRFLLGYVNGVLKAR